MTTSLPIRVALVGGQTIFRHALRTVLDGGGCVSVGEVDGDGAAQRPDIVLVDADSDGALDALPGLLAQGVKIVVLTASEDSSDHRRAVRLGARGLVLKHQTPDVLLQAIGRVHAGDLWLETGLVSSLLTETPRARLAERPADRAALLTEREREVVSLIAEGLCNKDISQRLEISETTVRHHLSAIFAKLGVRDRLQLAIYAFRTGLASPIA